MGLLRGEGKNENRCVVANPNGTLAVGGLDGTLTITRNAEEYITYLHLVDEWLTAWYKVIDRDTSGHITSMTGWIISTTSSTSSTISTASTISSISTASTATTVSSSSTLSTISSISTASTATTVSTSSTVSTESTLSTSTTGSTISTTSAG